MIKDKQNSKQGRQETKGTEENQLTYKNSKIKLRR